MTRNDNAFSDPPTDNQAYFEWSDPDDPAREVWYGLVSHPDEPIAFWFRYTLVSTAERSEARVWAALTDGRESSDDSISTFSSENYVVDAAILDRSPFALGIGANSRLRSDSSTGEVETDEGGIAWSLSYEPDELTFTPIRDEQLMRQSAEGMGTGVHWSANQSVLMNGTVTVDGTTFEFEQAPGHQGHTAGTMSPTAVTWVHCNSFEEDAAMSFEALSINDRLVPVCLRLPEETYLLNRQEDVFGDAVQVETNEPGKFELRGGIDSVEFEAQVETDGPFQKASYLVPDGSLRYNAHCSLATVELVVESAEGERRWTSESGRAEWVETTKPVAGDYPPFEGNDP